MELSQSIKSQTYFEFFDFIDPKAFAHGGSFRKRFFAFQALFELAFRLPIAVAWKLYKTICRAARLMFSASLLIFTMGTVRSTREFFLESLSSLTKDLGDWVLFPFAILWSFFRLAMASFVSPYLFFRF